MYFSRALIALVAPLLVLAQTQNGPNYFTNTNFTGIAAGKSFTLTWHPTTSGTVSLYLRDGSSSNLNKGTPIATGLQNSGSYTWNVPSDAVNGGSYTVEIVDDSDPSETNYTQQFPLTSTNLVSSSASSSTASSTSGSSSSSSTGSSSSTSGSSSSTSSSSSSTTSSSSSASPSNTSAGFQGSTSSHNAGPRATAMAGMMGIVALGALAL